MTNSFSLYLLVKELIHIVYFLLGSVLLGTLGVALGAYHSLYPITLLAPVVLILVKVSLGGPVKFPTKLVFMQQNY